MTEAKKEQLAVILSKAKAVETSDSSGLKSFSIEIIERDNDDEDSILFSSLEEAVTVISVFTGKHLKEEIAEDILSYVSIDALSAEPSFRLKITVS